MRKRKLPGGKFIKIEWNMNRHPDGFQGVLMQSSHIPWKLKRHACTDFGSRRGRAMKKKKWFLNNYC
jgi:hypothetical protein